MLKASPSLGALFVSLAWVPPTLDSATSSYQQTEHSVIREKEGRLITSSDLISLTDISPPRTGFSLSPDRSLLAIQVHRADILDNDYNVEWIAVSLSSPLASYSLGDGGNVILSGEYSGRINGARTFEVAKWSPDSEWIAYRAKHNGQVQLWRSSRDGKRQQQLTYAQGDILRFEWADDGERLLYQVGRNRNGTARKLKAEGESGFLFDERFWPLESSLPVTNEEYLSYPFQPSKSELWVYELDKSIERKAKDAEEQEFISISAPISEASEFESRDIRYIVSSAERPDTKVWAENTDPVNNPGYHAPLTLYARTVRFGEVSCRAKECTGRIFKLIWNENLQEVYFFRSEGPGYNKTGIYAWKVGQSDIRELILTDDIIDGCEILERELVCIYEAPTIPRKIVKIDIYNSRISDLFVPNDLTHQVQFTRVEKLEWKEISGRDAVGHLVYPYNYQEGKTYPLIIVQYKSRGFLRGGTGDEFPIHPLAAEGFFVLSFDRPIKQDVYEKTLDVFDAEKQFWQSDLWAMSSALSAIEIIIDDLVSRRLVDRSRVGITGLSDGAETLWYGLIHSDYFAAAATSSGGWSPSMYYITNRLARQKLYRYSQGLMPLHEDHDRRWERISPELNINKIDTPTLVQVADRELTESVSSIAALRDAKKPIEAYVFPDEYHIKWRPKHKLAVYNRTIDWFNFWLRGVEDKGLEKVPQYKRWRAMRDRRPN